METETVFFCILAMPDSGLIGGVIHQEDLATWDQSGRKLSVDGPARLSLSPIQRGKDIIGFNAMFGPVYPMHTEQKAMLLCPYMLEILGEVTAQENDVCVNGIVQVKDLFESYKSFRQGWRAQLAGITIPTVEESHNILDFPGKK